MNGQVRDFVAGGVELGERRHPANLLGETHQPVVVQDEALAALELTDRRRYVAQLVAAGNCERRLGKLGNDDLVWSKYTG